MRFVTPSKKAHGLGPVKTGVHHWTLQRLTALTLIPLTLWGVVSVVTLVGSDYASVMAWFAEPLTAVMLSLWVFFTTYHASLGMQVIIEDYIHHQATKLTALILVKFTLILLGTLSVITVLQLHFQTP